jgi:hypothetical protein
MRSQREHGAGRECDARERRRHCAPTYRARLRGRNQAGLGGRLILPRRQGERRTCRRDLAGADPLDQILRLALRSDTKLALQDVGEQLGLRQRLVLAAIARV